MKNWLKWTGIAILLMLLPMVWNVAARQLGYTAHAPNASLQAETVRSQGYLVYYNHNWTDKWTSAIGFSQHKQSNTDGQLGTAFRRGSYGSLNVLYQMNKNVMTGGEYIWGKNESRDGAGATDARLQWSTRVTF